MEGVSMFCVSLHIVFGLFLTSHTSHGVIAHAHYTDSMAYDDIIRDVPRMLHKAQDRSPTFIDMIRHMTSLSVTAGMEDMIRRHKQGGDSFVSSLRWPTSPLTSFPTSFPNQTIPKSPPSPTASTTPTPAFSPECRQHFAAFFDGSFHGQEWALRMIDAWGKPQSGILEAHVRSFGDFYECRQIKGVQAVDGVNVTVQGKYCLATLGVYEDNAQTMDISSQEGMCVPKACTDQEIYMLVDEILERYNVSDDFPSRSVVCHYDQSLDGWAIFGLTFVLFLVAVTIAATLVDFAYPVVVPVPWTEEEKAEVERNGNNRTSMNINHNQSGHLHAFPATSNHVVSSDYQPLTASQVYSNRLREKTGIQVLLCFSLRANFNKLMDTGGKQDSMACIHGLRFFTISWIIIGHTILLTAKRAENFVSYAKITVPYITYQLFVNGSFGCDSFLCFSGILVCYNLMHTLKYFKGKMRWHLFYIYRYMRLTPAMAVVMLLYSTTFPYWYDGPIWVQGGLEPGRCRNTWWKNMLYINNYFHEQCMGWLWYLAVDTQLYAISPIFATLLYKRPRLGIYFICVTLVVSTIGTAYIAYDIQLLPSSFSVMEEGLQTKGDPMVEYYYASYCRLSPYLIGMLAGYLLYVNDRKLNISWFWQTVGWLFVLPTSSFVVFGLYKASLFQTGQVPLTLAQAVAYNTLSRPVWGFGVAWTIVMCVTGHGGPLNAVLSWKPLVPFARSTYMAYMIHVIIILWYVLTSQRPIFITDPLLFLLFFGFIFMTYFMAFPATLLVEAPVMALQKMMINRHNKGKDKETTKKEQDQGE